MVCKKAHTLAVTAAFAAILSSGASTSVAQLDETWTLMVNGQAVQAEPDGTFRIPNIASPDQLPLGIPGVRPCCDFLGDEPIRVIGFSTFNGITRYAFSEPFRISRGVTFRIERLTIGLDPPPFPVAISITVDMPTLTTLGETAQATVLGTLLDGITQIDVTEASEGTVYRTSNPSIATVDENGLVTAIGAGQAFITATNSGATTVTRVFIIPGDPLTTLEGFVQFLDGEPVERAEVSILALPGTAITDADGFFSIPDLPSQLGQPFTVRASVVFNQQSFVGTAAQVEPVPGMITDAGIITVLTTGGGLGPIIISGMDPEDHGSPGQQMIRDLMDFVVGESALHASPSKIAMLGGSSSRASNAASIASGLGFTLSHFTGQGILDVDLSPRTTRFDAIYMPTSSADISGGISFSDMARIDQRGPQIVRFVNAGGGLAALAQNVSGGYGWLPLGGLDTVNLGGGGRTGIALTPEGVFLLSPSATSVQPFHTAFIGPPEFFGLDVLAIESFGLFRPLIIGGLGSIPPDCNGNGLEDVVDLANGTSEDCDENGIPDECDDDCNTNNIPDACDVRDGTSVDVIGPGAMADGVPDECQPDCNGNSVPDLFDIENGTSIDCNGNGIPDDCDLAGGGSIDCNANAVPDSCDIASGTSIDCNLNSTPDECDVESGSSGDCNGNGIPDECDTDCNGNSVADECDVANGTSPDCNGNVIPDECDLASGVSADCNGNSTPDECDIASAVSADVIGPGALADGVPDECQVDCNGNLTPDGLDLGSGTSPDCNRNIIPDECDVADGTSADCNTNSVPDECDIATTIVYDITLADLVNISNTCFATSVFNDCSAGQPGFTWQDQGTGPVLAATVEFNVGVECHATGTPHDTSLNGVPVPSFLSTSSFCSCGFTDGIPVGINVGSASYNLGGSNTFLITNPTTCLGFITRAIWGSGIFARVTIDYAPLNDCNFNSIPDDCDLADGTSVDANGDGLPDECGLDCNGNGLADPIDIAVGSSQDCNGNIVPDECDISSGASADVIGAGALADSIPDDCQDDCNVNLVPDELEIADGTSEDCNGNGVPDDCDLSSGTSSDANGNSVPDECQTNVIGLVVDSAGLVVSGATLTANGGVTGNTLSDGSFTIINVPATLGDIVVNASAVVGGITQTGSSMPVMPVPAGVTDVGTIILMECGFETSIGTGLNQSDDDTDFVAFSGGFTFPYFGTVQTGVFINSNGNLTFDSGNTTFNPSIPGGVVNGLPRISPAFVDLNPAAGGDVFVNQLLNRFVATWSHVPLFGEGGDNTFQVILHSGGRIDFIYNGMTADGAVEDISVAASSGGTPALLTVDYTLAAPFSSAAATEAVFENFNSGNLFDLDFHCIIWEPNGSGGFDVGTFQFAPCVPAGTVSGIVLDSEGDPVANCPVIVTSSGDPSFLEVTQTGSDGSFEISGVAVPGGINVRVLPINGIDLSAAATGILRGEGETLHVVVSPPEPMQKR